MNKLGINLWNWVSGLSDECLGLPAKVSEMGFTAIELPMTVTHISDELKSEIVSSGLEVTLCAALGAGKDLSSFDSSVRENTMRYLTESLELGEKTGAVLFCGPLYAGGGKRHFLSDDDRKREWDLAVTGLREVSRRAAEYGIRLALEPLNRYRTSVINTIAQDLELIRDIDCENVGIHYDTYHACFEEADLEGSLAAALESGKLFHFHACANNRGAPGSGIIPWKELLDMLVRHGYEGHITMETFALGGLDSSFINVHGTPDEVAEAGIGFLRGYFGADSRTGR